jgi:nanoRNase/pAp phosphatase (c-di-AMP/oligoRNAs hydrolase)
MGGGGHEVAAGAKREGESLEQVKSTIIELAGGILAP